MSSMDFLVQNSIKLSGPTLFSDGPRVQVFVPQVVVNNVYNVHNGVVAFVWNGIFYVTPLTRDAIVYIRENGLAQQKFCVPSLSKEILPLDSQQRLKWLSILTESKKIRTLGCIEFAEQYEIGKLKPELLAHCFKMPLEGVKVNGFFGHSLTHMPESCGGCYVEKVGCFALNHGVCMFVHYDGTTWVTRSRQVIDTLPTLNYFDVGKSLFVPFSNGEVIEDPVLAEKWEKCC